MSCRAKIEEGIEYLKRNDPILRNLIWKIGDCRLALSKDYFNDIIRSIISQQLSVKAASTITNRFYDLVGTVNPESVCNYTVTDFRNIGVSNQKSKYILDFSNKINARVFSFDLIETMSDKEVVEKLTSINGIGNWTAQMFLIFALNRLDVLPIDDVGFRRAIIKNYEIGDTTKLTHKILEISKSWGQYKSLAAWYLWKDIDS